MGGASFVYGPVQPLCTYLTAPTGPLGYYAPQSLIDQKEHRPSMAGGWTEKYRPITLDEVVGNGKALEQIRRWVKDWEHGHPKKRALILSGDPGVGKTASALALVNEYGWIWLWRDGRRGVFIFCATIVYLLLMPYLGFSLSNFLLLLIVFRGLGGHSWIKNASIAFGITLFLHIALIVFMQLSIPRLTMGGISI